MFMQNQENSFETQVQSLKQYTQSCPVSLYVTLNNNIITFAWDCKNVSAKSCFFNRHIVVIHTQSFLIEQVNEILRIYYKYLKLGDFMRVILINSVNRIAWIQKTSQKLDLQLFITKNDKTTKSVYQSIFKHTKNSSDPTLLSVFTRNVYQFNQKHLSMLLEAKQRYSFSYIFNMFYYQNQNTSNFHYVNNNTENYTFSNINQLQSQIKFSSFQLNKVRLIKSQLRVRCQNNELDLRQFATNRWQNQDDSLVINNFALKNNYQYIQSLQLQIDNKILVCLQVEFKIITINNEQYLMKTSLSFNCQNRKSSNMDMILPQPIGKNQPLRAIQYSVMNKERYKPKFGDKVILRQRKSNYRLVLDV